MEAEIDPRSSYGAAAEGLTEMAHLVMENEKLRRKLKKAHHRRDHYARLYYRVLAELDETKWELSVARGKIRELRSQVTVTQQTGTSNGSGSQHPGPTHSNGSDSHTTSPDSGASLSPRIEPVNPQPFTHQNKAKTLPANLRHTGLEVTLNGFKPNVHKNAWNVDSQQCQQDEPDSRPQAVQNEQIPKSPVAPTRAVHQLAFSIPHLVKPFSFSQGDQPFGSPFLSTNRKSSAPPPAPPTGSYSLSQEVFVTSPPPSARRPAFQRSLSMSQASRSRPPLSASAHFRSRTAGYEKGFFSGGDVLSSPELSHTSAFKKPILKRVLPPQKQPLHPQPPPEPRPHPDPHPALSRSRSQPDPHSLSHQQQQHPLPQTHTRPHPNPQPHPQSSQPPPHPRPHSPSQTLPEPSPSHSQPHPQHSHPHNHPHQQPRPHPNSHPHPQHQHPPSHPPSHPHPHPHPASHLQLQLDTNSIPSGNQTCQSPSAVSRASVSSAASSTATLYGSSTGLQDHFHFENLSGVQLLDLLAGISDPACDIVKLEVASSGLGQPEAMKLFCKDLLRNKSIVELSLPSNGINLESLRVLLECVQHCDNIRELILRNNSIGKECAEIIKAFLKKANLDSLVLTGNEIEQFGHLLNGGLPSDFTMEYDTTDGSEDSGLVVADSENVSGPNEQSLSRRYKYHHF